LVDRMVCNLLLFPAMNPALRVFRIVCGSWIALILAASGNVGVVLCVGADGHFALEPAHQGRCQDTADVAEHDHSADASLLSAVDSACSEDCVDVSLLPDTMSQPASKVRHNRSNTDELVNVVAASLMKPFFNAGVYRKPPLKPGKVPLLASSVLQARRTLVLLI